ncbi:HlyD family efflux transporter periplasmic adaptor subunit [Crocosphaera sp. UHCC 0190]|uniref:HlyD family efflux transporter periplasmic adaptor subunit n=1 Tax=Crocosphaera sp. UHCC 0190 TaxID=3110246 RepID=UPI002B1FF597|nr:HlyD family efflux transporter periplasmic adaptor subunit [Crocosphaera sp. UHCC 0190]MEA5512388.1 HlyD family efflux transporter periplasmic adaptor subunit [Crocosphaera sp. UHCC 0190]
MLEKYSKGQQETVKFLNKNPEGLSAAQPASSPGESGVTQDATLIYGGVSSPTIPMTSPPSISFPKPSTDERARDWSLPVNSLLDQPPATLPQWLILSGMAFCLVFGTWAWFGTIEEVGKAQGKLVPEGETYKIQPIELGKVTQISVKEGQTVQAGQLLVELDTELAQKEIERLQQAITAYYLEFSQKQTLQERIQLEAKTAEAISAAELQAQQAVIANTKEKIATIRQLLAQQQTEAVAYQSRQRDLQPLSSTAQEKLSQLQAEKIAHQERIARLLPLQEEGAVSQDYIFQAEQALRETEQRITSSQLQEVTSANEQMFQANQAMRDLQSHVTENRGELLTAYQGVQQAQAELTGKKAEAQRAQLEASQRIQQLAVEITQLQGKIAESKNLLVAAQAKLKYRYLRAPVSGTVLSLNLKNAGQVLEAGQTVAEIAPEGTPLVVSAVLPTQEAGFVKPGMPVKVKLDAYPYQDYGVIPGQVTEISADAKSDEKLGEFYRVEVKLERDHVMENQKVVPFKPGQTVTADIIIRRRRIIDVLLDPIKQMQKDGINL